MSKAAKIIGTIEAVTAKWAKQRKAEERHASAIANRRSAMMLYLPTTIKDAAWDVMEQAYLKASANGRLPANARQIMYAARPYIQEQTNKNLNDNYFTQTLLPEYINDKYEKCAGWNVAYDARGHFYEPHTRYEVPPGALRIGMESGPLSPWLSGDVVTLPCQSTLP